MMPLLLVSPGGWDLLPLVCDGCGQILPDVDSPGTKSLVLTVEFHPWGPLHL